VDAGVEGDDLAIINRFQEFLRIPGVSFDGPHDGSYAASAAWLASQCQEVFGDSATVRTLEPVKKKPVVIVTLAGQDPSLPSILLNSHYDVVPVMREQWCCDPFGAEIRDGYVGPQVPDDLEPAGPCIYARGAQDMKCVCIQYLEALRRLRKRPEGWKPLRTLHLTFVPDEEIGGADGMGAFLKTSEFAEMQPIALALDEGLANDRDVFTVFYGERTPWWLLVRAEGPTGHGSRFIKDTAVEKLMGVVNKALAFRREQEMSLNWDIHAGCKHAQAKKLGDVTTLNVTMLKGGVSVDGGKTYSLNVVPTEMEAGFDVRICPSLATSEFKAKLDEWCSDEGLSWKFAPWTIPLHQHYLTETDLAKNPFWGIFEDACHSQGAKVEREIFPAGTDSRLLRALGIGALGFSPMKRTPILLHEHNEALSVATLLQGIDMYEKILDSLCNANRQATEEGVAKL
jgi:aminoacylase